MQTMLLVGFAGLLGTLARYGISEWFAQRFRTFPAATLVVNLAGCFLVGFLFQSFQERYLVSPLVRATVFVGFLGGFTTFSAYALQTFILLRDQDVWLAVANVVISNVVGIVFVAAGYAVSKSI